MPTSSSAPCARARPKRKRRKKRSSLRRNRQRKANSYIAALLAYSWLGKNRYLRHWFSLRPSKRINWRLVCRLNGRGGRNSFIPASSGVRLPFLLLQGWQHATKFSQVVSPARERGIT